MKAHLHPADLRALIGRETAEDHISAVLYEGDGDALTGIAAALAESQPQVVPVYAVLSPAEDYPLEWLVTERSVSTNTAAAGGNASLMSIG